MDIVEKVDRVTNENFIEVPERLRAMCKLVFVPRKESRSSFDNSFSTSLKTVSVIVIKVWATVTNFKV